MVIAVSCGSIGNLYWQRTLYDVTNPTREFGMYEAIMSHDEPGNTLVMSIWLSTWIGFYFTGFPLVLQQALAYVLDPMLIAMGAVWLTRLWVMIEMHHNIQLFAGWSAISHNTCVTSHWGQFGWYQWQCNRAVHDLSIVHTIWWDWCFSCSSLMGRHTVVRLKLLPAMEEVIYWRQALLVRCGVNITLFQRIGLYMLPQMNVTCGWLLSIAFWSSDCDQKASSLILTCINILILRRSSTVNYHFDEVLYI